MKGLKRRISAFVLVLAMAFTMVPLNVFAATNPLTLTLRSESGTLIEGATVTATATRNNRSYTLDVVEAGDGKYTIYRDNYTSRWYTINIQVTHPDYESGSASVRGSTTATTITLTPLVVEDQWQEFELFYFLNGSESDPFPANYAAAGDVGNYGPSGDNTPFVILNVNVTALEENYPDVVLYEENTSEGNDYQFTPVDSSDRMAASAAFWEAVLACTDEESLAALEATGISDWFIGYVAKYDGSAYHIDGILEVTPPVYSIELYKDDTASGGTYSYVGGLLTNKDEEFKTVDEVLTALEGYLGYTITWEEDANGKPIANNGVYTGTYFHNKNLHTITVYQSNVSAAQEIEGSEIPYEEKSDYYYVAYYVLNIEEGHQVEFTVTYTDGDANDTAFYEHSYGVSHTGNTYPNVPAFTGVAVREGYHFLGWILEGGDGSLLSDSQVQAMTVTEDMVFHAEWEPIPVTHIGAVHVILNGTYDATNHTITSGTFVDIDDMSGKAVQLYLKEENGTEYILLTEQTDEVGVYTAELYNGNYSIYYSVDGGTTITQIDEQILTINDADRHRYLFFNSVEYDLNGGSLDSDFPTLYYLTGRKHVHLTSAVPTRDRYVFSHWTDQDGNVYAPGALLTEEIAKAYVLTAQWVDAIDLYLDIQIKHIAADGVSHNNDQAMHDIFFTLDQRTTVGDYTEIYTQTLEWDGKSVFEHPVFEGIYVLTNRDFTTYSAVVPVQENVLKDAEYTFTTTKSGYTLESVTQTVDENGDITIQAVLIYDPNDFDFVYTVRLDEEAKALPDSFRPVAVNVKVTAWGDTVYDEDYGLQPGDDTVDWYTISQQRYTYERVVLDENGEGVGSYPAWIATTDETPMTYYYRIEVVSYEMPDGSINPAVNVDRENVTYLSDCEHIEANVVVTGGQSPDETATDLHGAYYENGAQVGAVEAVVSIHTYSVTFVPNGGALNGTEENTVVEPLFQVPHLDEYVPVRDGGYVFDGWYLADENGNMTQEPGVSFDPLHADITLIAKWKEPLTIAANIAVDITYEQENSDGSVTLHTIHEKERATYVIVSLQKILENGYAETISTQDAAITYTDGMGGGYLSFTQVPDDGHQYRILVIAPNYEYVYQNEPESLDESKNTDFSGSYNSTDYLAVYDGDQKAVINAYGVFKPATFAMEYEVEADAIGEGFRPENAQILITHDDDEGILNPSQWPVISQMEFGDTVVGLDTALTDGMGSGSFPAWQTYPDGRVAEYALRLQATTTDGVYTLYDAANAPFSVIYHVPAYFAAPDGQSQMLVAELVPNTYPVNYELNGGTANSSWPSLHTWSFETVLSGDAPTKTGYVFDGWYLDEELTVSAGDVIDASVHEETTLYAKWKLAQDKVNLTVVIDHMQGNDPESSSGQAATYERLLYTQLLSHPDGGEGVTYETVAGTELSFDSSDWHTALHGTAVEEFSVSGLYMNLPSDMAYSAIASMEGYEIVPEECSVTPNYDEDSETGTTYDVVVYLKYHPELMDIEFTVRMDETVDEALDPAAAQVKVTSWYNEPTTEYALGWFEITQHKENYVTVALDDETRSGVGTYQVWQWYLEEQGIPFYYRIEVVGLVLDDGTVVEMQPQQADVSYTGGIYTATVYADNGAEVPVPQDETYTTALTGVYGDDSYEQVGTLEAVITVKDPIQVTFHSNNSDASEGDTFRTYYSAGAALPEGDNNLYLNGDGSVAVFYDIPTFAYTDHNGYIFKGWYMGTEADAQPMDWNAAYTADTHIYAHWVYVGKVEREEDGKIYASDSYCEYDLVGNQIRTAQVDESIHYGDAAPGLRFVAALSERVYAEMKGIHVNNNADIEYGFVIGFADAAKAKANGEDYQLKYKHASLNGEDTTESHSYVNNVACRLLNVPVDDHYDGESYRLYTAVITYNGLEGDRLTAAQNTNFIARAYLRYFDANGLERVHYNNYTGDSQTYGGVNTCYTTVNELVKDAM